MKLSINIGLIAALSVLFVLALQDKELDASDWIGICFLILLAGTEIKDKETSNKP